MRVFCASVATETNTFSPLRTDISHFKESFYAFPGSHPKTPTLCSAVFTALRDRARGGEINLIEGTATWAEPGGLINCATWNHLRDELLGQISDALPLDAVLLGLHGAMIADGCVDCEGELIEAVRNIVGTETKIGVTFDPHSHLSEKRVKNTDIITVFKEFPHSDFVETAENCVDLTLKAANGVINPVISVADTQMIDIFPTSIDPMRSFVDRIKSMEGQNNIHSISIIHGFMAGDSPDLGTKVTVITENDKNYGDVVAQELSDELFSLRGRTRPPYHTAEESLRIAKAEASGPVVIADVWNNPGGGVPGDSTVFASAAIEMDMQNLALGTIWDPGAVRLCHAAGEGAHLKLRFGGKTSDLDGDPIDATVEITKTVRNAVQSFGKSSVPLGDAAAIRIGGVEIVLNSIRSQTFSPTLFHSLGIDPTKKKTLIVTSTNHFFQEFSAIAKKVLYAEVPSSYPQDPCKTEYTRLKRAIWPIHSNPNPKEIEK